MLTKRSCYFTHDAEEAKRSGDHLYYIYLRRVVPQGTIVMQRRVEAVLDLDKEGRLVGIELPYNMPPPPGWGEP